MQITSDLVKELREKTNAGVMDCKKALAKVSGNFEEAVKILKSQGAVLAQKKAQRVASEGSISSYIHMGGKIGVLLEINCETDFVARNKIFQDLVKDIALQIAGAHPVARYVSRDELCPEEIQNMTRQLESEFQGKSLESVKKIVEGKLEKYYGEVCLMDQPFIKDSAVTLKQLVQSKIAELGENIVVRRFVRYQVGEAVIEKT